MALQVDLPFFFFRSPATSASACVEFVVFMNYNSVVTGGNAGVPDLFAFFESRGGEFDVIGLPSEWRKAHV